MSLTQRYAVFRSTGYQAARTLPATDDPLDHFYLALLAFGEGDFAQAARSARRAAALAPDHVVFEQGAVYLERVSAQGKAGVYVDGAAFAAFIRGGGNVGLYAAISEALRAIYQDYSALSLLDIGVGDGLALLPALTAQVSRLDLVEPSGPMLARTVSELEGRGVAHRAFGGTIQDFMADTTRSGERWDIIQATWSLQSLSPAARLPVFAWAREHGARFLVAEFDVPAFDDLYAPERVRHIVGRYLNGLAEYAGDGGQVAQGFLMPVLFGYFDRTAARTNDEGPLAGWIESLHASGFEQVAARKLFAYWWADAYLLDAH